MIEILRQKYSRSRNYFSASHLLPGYSKCERLHGHNYAVKVTIEYRMTQYKEIVDFRVINSTIQSIIEQLDHKILLPGCSAKMEIIPDREDANWLVKIGDKQYSFPQKDVLILDNVDQTTAENLSVYFHGKLSSKLEKVLSEYPNVNLSVTISETSGNEVIYESK